MLNIKTSLAIAVACVSAMSISFANADKRELIGTEYTPWGAEMQGNSEGTIPAFGGPPPVPASYDPAKPGVRPDPFADDKPLFSITPENMDQYADKLTEGLKEMFRKYPTFRMDIYPTRRTASYPEFYLNNAKKNLDSCKTVNNGLGLTGCYAGTPFPFPKDGNEVLWNRFFKYEHHAIGSDGMHGIVVDRRGREIITGVARQEFLWPIFDPNRTEPVGDKEFFQYQRVDYSEPARMNGERLVIQDSIDMVGTGRSAWQYLPGQRRVKLAPDIAYDSPSLLGAGIAVVDELAIFYGATDRYDMNLQGKQEMFIPYNSYKLNDANQCSHSVAHTPNHLNPDCVRWELHRTWKVEANLKDGQRHIYPRRVMYLDEDLYGTGISDNYDASGNIYRLTMSFPITLYEDVGHATDETVTYDLATTAYHRSQSTVEGGGYTIREPRPLRHFNPQSLSGGGIR